jgi:hypothetical protein
VGEVDVDAKEHMWQDREELRALCNKIEVSVYGEVTI